VHCAKVDQDVGLLTLIALVAPASAAIIIAKPSACATDSISIASTYEIKYILISTAADTA
jgi:hypothetical protein